MFVTSRLWEKFLGRRSATKEIAAIRSKIDTFRDLLSANCRAMEIIADAGEKLGGEYVFDMQPIMEISVPLPYSLKAGVERTVEWLRERERGEI